MWVFSYTFMHKWVTEILFKKFVSTKLLFLRFIPFNVIITETLSITIYVCIQTPRAIIREFSFYSASVEKSAPTSNKHCWKCYFSSKGSESCIIIYVYLYIQTISFLFFIFQITVGMRTNFHKISIATLLWRIYTYIL